MCGVTSAPDEKNFNVCCILRSIIFKIDQFYLVYIVFYYLFCKLSNCILDRMTTYFQTVNTVYNYCIWFPLPQKGGGIENSCCFQIIFSVPRFTTYFIPSLLSLLVVVTVLVDWSLSLYSIVSSHHTVNLDRASKCLPHDQKERIKNENARRDREGGCPLCRLPSCDSNLDSSKSSYFESYNLHKKHHDAVTCLLQWQWYAHNLKIRLEVPCCSYSRLLHNQRLTIRREKEETRLLHTGTYQIIR